MDRPEAGPGLPAQIDRGVLHPVQTERSVRVDTPTTPVAGVSAAPASDNAPSLPAALGSPLKPAAPGLPPAVQSATLTRPTPPETVNVPVGRGAQPATPENAHGPVARQPVPGHLSGLPRTTAPVVRAAPADQRARAGDAPAVDVRGPTTRPAPGLPAGVKQNVGDRPAVPTIRESERRSPGLPSTGSTERGIPGETPQTNVPANNAAPELPVIPHVESTPFLRGEVVYRDGPATYQPPRFS